MTADAALIAHAHAHGREIAAALPLTEREELERWRLQRWNEALVMYDTMPPGLYQRIMSDTPVACAERMRRAAG